MTFPTVSEALGRTLGARYTIERELAAPLWVMSYAARAVGDDTPLEIRSIWADQFGEAGPPSDAILAARRLRHANIVPITAAGTRGGAFYWIAPVVEGRTLRARLSRGGKMELGDALTVLRDVSAALTHAHLHGIVHGGLTPDSIVISGGSALVADIGVAEAMGAIRGDLSSSESRAAASELLRYASPEQAAGREPDARSDVYAWGVIAYEVLSGRHPFAGRATPGQLMAAHKDEAPPPLGTSGPPVPQAVTRLVMRCLSKNPGDRPESARQILSVLTDELLVPPPAPRAGTGQKLVMGAFAAALVLLGVVAWLGR